MREQVYAKFAEALGRRQATKVAADRAAVVHVKFAEALQRQRLTKQAAGLSPALTKVLQRLSGLYSKMAPEVNASNWGKFNPLRLFTSKTRTPVSVTNTRPFTPAELGKAPTGSGEYAYGGGGGGQGPIRPYSELPSTGGFKETTRLSPAKILAALGLGTGGTAAVSALKDKANAPAVAQTPSQIPQPTEELWRKILSHQKMQMALAGAGLLAAGGIGGYMLSRGRDDEKKRS